MGRMALPSETSPLVPIEACTGHWINGERVEGNGDRIDVVNPATEEVIASVPAGAPADVYVAVAAARGAFPGWSARSVADRAAVVARISQAIAARRDELAALITAEMGSPIT